MGQMGSWLSDLTGVDINVGGGQVKMPTAPPSTGIPGGYKQASFFEENKQWIILGAVAVGALALLKFMRK